MSFRIRKKIALAAVVLAAAVSAAAFSGCEAVSGKSAYEIAVENGFTGSEKDWLDSLKGTDGTGITVEDLFEAYKAESPESTMSDFFEEYLDFSGSSEIYAVQKALKSAVIIKTPMANVFGQATKYSLGSGVVYKIDGRTAYIITNYHVVYNSDTNTIGSGTKIYLYNRYTADDNSQNAIDAEFVGGSKTYDIAVLKATDSCFLDDSIVRAADIDVSEPVTGETCIAVGSPENPQISATRGIVSVESEHITVSLTDSYSDVSQIRVFRTDTALNSGNSGGGVFNADGELIGIANAKNGDASVDNMCYAIPSVIAVNVADNIIETRGGVKYLLGITLTASSTTTRYSETADKIETIDTVTVSGVSPSSICAGDLRNGDILLSLQINDESPCEVSRIYNPSEYMLRARAGDTVTITYLRNGTQRSFDVVMTKNNAASLDG